MAKKVENKGSSAIAERLVEFGQSQFGRKRGWAAAFARALGVSAAYLYQYTSGRKRPGAEMHTKLRSMRCDIEWLMTGKKAYRSNAIGVQRVREKEGSYFPQDLPESTKKNVRELMREVSELEDADVDKVRELIRTIFGTKRTERKK